MDINTLTNTSVRVLPKLHTTGTTKTAGEDELTRLIAKILPSELNRRVTLLRGGVNNLNSQLKSVWGRLVDHPQGGLASLDEHDMQLPPLLSVAKRLIIYDDEAASITDEINNLVNSGDFAERISQISGLNPNKVTPPTVGIATTIAIDKLGGQTEADVENELKSNGLWRPSFSITHLVPQQDEKLILILDALSKKMSEHHDKLAARVRAAKVDKPVTREEVIQANHKFIHSLDGEREKIRLQLGNGPQMLQVDNLLDHMLKTGMAMIDVFNYAKLSNGENASASADPQSVSIMEARAANTDEEFFDSIGLDI